MTYIILGIITIFLAVIGFIEIMRYIVSRLYKTENTESVMLIFPDNSTSGSIEYSLRSYAERIRWIKNHPVKKIICICDGLNAESEQICSLICSEYEFIETMTMNDFAREFSKQISKDNYR